MASRNHESPIQWEPQFLLALSQKEIGVYAYEGGEVWNALF